MRNAECGMRSYKTRIPHLARCIPQGYSAPRTPHPAFQRGQATLEYAVVVAAVSAALLAMKLYMRRGIAGELRRAADSLGEQYDPRNTTGSMTLGSFSNTATTTITKNEPEMTAFLKDECQRAGRPAAECNAICASFDDDTQCDNPRAFGTRSRAILNNETITRSGNETVGALGDDLWN